MSPDVIAYVVSAVVTVLLGVVSWIVRNALEGAQKKQEVLEERMRQSELKQASFVAREEMQETEKRIEAVLKEMRTEIKADIRELRDSVEKRK